MKTKVFILKVSLMYEDGSYDYTNIKGVFFNRDDAWKKAKEQIEHMKCVWPGSTFKIHNGEAVYLVSDTGLAKWYEVIEMVVE